MSKNRNEFYQIQAYVGFGTAIILYDSESCYNPLMHCLYIRYVYRKHHIEIIINSFLIVMEDKANRYEKLSFFECASTVLKNENDDDDRNHENDEIKDDDENEDNDRKINDTEISNMEIITH
uniref:Uncharacterized protein n=1 Tax=Rhizophagus irregularis (strain DAOM 181602 / DAOM 197198 / MUCL 43194) TaxID=747089 RepID=U9UEN5_RHIID